jgi:hypothetical protein
MSEKPRPIGDVLDGLGVTTTPEDGELIASAVVLLRVIDSKGDERLTLVHSEGQGWIKRLGMLRAAEAVEASDVTSAQIGD